MALNPPVFTVAELRAHIGQEVGCASWLTISQEMIDTFANLTNDHQYIHVNQPRAMTETSYGGTIVHGFLTLSMLTQMLMDWRNLERCDARLPNHLTALDCITSRIGNDPCN